MVMTLLVLSSLINYDNSPILLYTKLASVSDPIDEYNEIKMHIECTFYN